MSLHTSIHHKKTSNTKGKVTGWAAFDLKHRQGQALGAENEQDHYPPISGSFGSLNSCQNHGKKKDFSMKPFSSVVLSSTFFPALSHDSTRENQLEAGNSRNAQGSNKVRENHAEEIKKLKELYCWAEDDLIQDIVEALANDFVKASTLLEGMLFAGIFSEDKEQEMTRQNIPSSDISCDSSVKDKHFSSRKVTESNAVSDTLFDDVKIIGEDWMGECASSAAKDCDDPRTRATLGRFTSLPPEPEWEEDDDVYLRFRGDAIRVMRSASQQSRAAQNAFLRGDHSSARRHSLKAREEWLVAERFNDRAAKDILSARNSKNDLWTLDLHGLHKMEAIQALSDRLQIIESLLRSYNRSVSPKRVYRLDQKSGVTRSASLEYLTHSDKEKPVMHHLPRERRLQVITGVGNHSRMLASLPAAVRSFLNENGYRFDETRPGVTTVWPKFRLN